MRSRLPLLLLLGALLAAAILLLQSGADHAQTASEDEVAASSNAAATQAAELDADAADLTRTKVRPHGGAEAGSVAAADEGPPVDLVVQLLTETEAGLAAPRNCAGWVVVAQSWVRETREIVHHEARADRNGVARFTFPGFVHVDWIACQPPAASSLGYTIHEPHSDVDGGSTVEMELRLEPGHPVVGRVLDLRDQPVAGVRVHLFNPSWTYGMDDWTPGFLQAVSDGNGRFAFPTLASGEWVVAVEPGAWLQVDPSLGEAITGRSLAEVQALAPPPSELTLRVAPANRTEILVLDAGGRPAHGLTIWAEPIRLEDIATASDGDDEPFHAIRSFGRLTLSGRLRVANNWSFSGVTISGNSRPSFAEEPEEDAAVPAEPEPEVPEQEGPTWNYGAITAVTDAQGRATLALPAGLWRISIDLGAANGLADPPQPVETAVPGPRVEFHLPFHLHPFRGRIVDARSAAVAGATVVFECQESGAEIERTTDARGEFHLTDVPGVGRWRMTVRCPDLRLATTAWDVDVSDPQARDYLMPDAGHLRVELIQQDGLPAHQANGYLRFRASGLEALPVVPGALAGTPVPASDGAEVNVSGTAAEFDVLSPGSYHVELWANLWDGTWGEWGGPNYAERMLASWDVHTRPEPWRLRWDPVEADLQMDDYAILKGVVRDANDGKPLEGVHVIGRTPDYVLAQAYTDAQGAYEMLARPGELELWAHTPGFIPTGVPNAVHGPGEHENHLRLSGGGGELSLLVLDRNGRRVQGFELRLFDGAGRPILASTNAGSRNFGNLSDAIWCGGAPILLRDVPPGALTLVANFMDIVQARATAIVAPGANGRVEARLDKSLEEILKALDEDPGHQKAAAVQIDLTAALLEALEQH